MWFVLFLAEPAHVHCGKVRSPMQEEAMQLRPSSAATKRVHFEETPSFQVGEMQHLDLFTHIFSFLVTYCFNMF